jgi:hypothetical protein
MFGFRLKFKKKLIIIRNSDKNEAYRNKKYDNMTAVTDEGDDVAYVDPKPNYSER